MATQKIGFDKVWEYISEVAEEYGFTARENKWQGWHIEDSTHTVNFHMDEEHDYDLDNHRCTVTYKPSASIAIMGGNPTADELMNCGYCITAAGKLVQVLNGHPELLTYVVTW